MSVEEILEAEYGKGKVSIEKAKKSKEKQRWFCGY